MHASFVFPSFELQVCIRNILLLCFVLKAAVYVIFLSCVLGLLIWLLKRGHWRNSGTTGVIQPSRKTA